MGRVDGDDRLFVVFPLQGCQACPTCLAGRENLCPERQLLGLDRPGTFAELVAVPAAALVPVPAGVPADVAALTEPLATALAVFSGYELSPGQRVAVIGCGSIGLLAVYAAVRAGCAVTAADPVANRRQAAIEVGASDVVESAEQWPAGAADFVVDAVGIEPTWTAALKAARPGGIVDVVGLGQSSGIVAVGDIVRSGLTLRGTYAYTREDFAAALAMLAERPPSDLVAGAAAAEGGTRRVRKPGDPPGPGGQDPAPAGRDHGLTAAAGPAARACQPAWRGRRPRSVIVALSAGRQHQRTAPLSIPRIKTRAVTK